MSAAAKARRTPWRDNVEALAIAVVVALVLKAFVVEAYKIPTGSMQPTLMGDERTGVFDRILVDKLCYRLREPRRWEVVVFRYPLDRSKNFVKRIAGLPGETFRIQRGDLWRRTPGAGADASWEILRRPRAVQADAWKRLDREEPARSRWRVTDGGDGVGDGGGDGWELDGRRVVARGPGKVRFGLDNGSVMDGYTHGYPDAMLTHLPEYYRGSNANPVGDLRLSGEVTALEGCERVELQLDEGVLRYVFELPGPAAPETARPAIRVVDNGADGAVVAEVAGDPWRLPAGRAVAFGAQNMDDLLELELDGAWLLALEVAPASDQRSAAHVAVAGAGADLADLMVARDIYYTAANGTGTREVQIPEGCYYMLGDNTQDSSDSREWTLVRYQKRSEPDAGRELRGNWIRNQNPREVAGGPDGLGGPEIFLRDEWGELQHFAARDWRRLPSQPQAFVPRRLIGGRAVAVFWPVSFRLGLWRLKWVH